MTVAISIAAIVINLAAIAISIRANRKLKGIERRRKWIT